MTRPIRGGSVGPHSRTCFLHSFPFTPMYPGTQRRVPWLFSYAIPYHLVHDDWRYRSFDGSESSAIVYFIGFSFSAKFHLQDIWGIALNTWFLGEILQSPLSSLDSSLVLDLLMTFPFREYMNIQLHRHLFIHISILNLFQRYPFKNWITVECPVDVFNRL